MSKNSLLKKIEELEKGLKKAAILKKRKNFSPKENNNSDEITKLFFKAFEEGYTLEDIVLASYEAKDIKDP